MIAESLFPLLSSDQSVFDAVQWRDYISECTRFIMVDSDSTDGLRKIRAGARSSGERKRLSRTAIEAGVAAFWLILSPWFRSLAFINADG